MIGFFKKSVSTAPEPTTAEDHLGMACKYLNDAEAYGGIALEFDQFKSPLNILNKATEHVMKAQKLDPTASVTAFSLKSKSDFTYTQPELTARILYVEGEFCQTAGAVAPTYKESQAFLKRSASTFIKALQCHDADEHQIRWSLLMTYKMAGDKENFLRLVNELAPTMKDKTTLFSVIQDAKDNNYAPIVKNPSVIGKLFGR